MSGLSRNPLRTNRRGMALLCVLVVLVATVVLTTAAARQGLQLTLAAQAAEDQLQRSVARTNLRQLAPHFAAQGPPTEDAPDRAETKGWSTDFTLGRCAIRLEVADESRKQDLHQLAQQAGMIAVEQRLRQAHPDLPLLTAGRRTRAELNQGHSWTSWGELYDLSAAAEHGVAVGPAVWSASRGLSLWGTAPMVTNAADGVGPVGATLSVWMELRSPTARTVELHVLERGRGRTARWSSFSF